jgi:hypothetical protein
MNLDLSVLDNEYMFVALTSLLALYGANTRVQLPSFIRTLFENNIFRVVFLSLLLIYKFDKAPQVATVVSLVFVLTMHHLSQMEIRENFAYVEAFRSSVDSVNRINSM